MKTVYDLYEARNWFQAHKCDKISCVQDNVRVECRSYPEAERFFLGWLNGFSKPGPRPAE